MPPDPTRPSGPLLANVQRERFPVEPHLDHFPRLVVDETELLTEDGSLPGDEALARQRVQFDQPERHRVPHRVPGPVAPVRELAAGAEVFEVLAVLHAGRDGRTELLADLLARGKRTEILPAGGNQKATA